MTTDSEAGQAYYQAGNVGSIEENFHSITILIHCIIKCWYR